MCIGAEGCGGSVTLIGTGQCMQIIDCIYTCTLLQPLFPPRFLQLCFLSCHGCGISLKLQTGKYSTFWRGGFRYLQFFHGWFWFLFRVESSWALLLGVGSKCWLYIILRAIEIQLCQIEYNFLLWVTFKSRPERDLSNRRGLSLYNCVILTWQHHWSRYLLSNKCSKVLRSSLWSSLVEIV